MKQPGILPAVLVLFFLPFYSGVVESTSVASNVTPQLSQIVGNWQSNSFGTQVLKAKNDGTAELKMRLNTMAAALYGREVTLQLEWQCKGNTLTQRVVGGSPERSVKKLIKKFGETFTYEVIELTHDQLLVKDASTGKTCCWKALSETQTTP